MPEQAWFTEEAYVGGAMGSDGALMCQLSQGLPNTVELWEMG